jgi:hypothetical protein
MSTTEAYNIKRLYNLKATSQDGGVGEIVGTGGVRVRDGTN